MVESMLDMSKFYMGYGCYKFYMGYENGRGRIHRQLFPGQSCCKMSECEKLVTQHLEC